ncbi:dethiobiotin synthase [Telmatospirillum siberiense]|uniref:ATP-dependent dethiobiotin synthetase BioD n=1 Tax=Telmatospirillum siberiense TaxID=382514 RepID=A0A2N3PTS7_9PROT|nr:dethiobiotin synthase [Telmatospirillum siberiense]PKU23800.1 dethiobiotin synthase [Telmatospirillum siberiense]
MRGVFVTGTDTGIGKTMVAAWLVRSWRADYWKPVQSGIAEGLDADVVRRVAPETAIHPSAFMLNEPLSPDQAARLDGVAISLDDFHLPETSNSLVVEGAGGAMVPLNDRHMMIDLMARLGLPVVLVARSGLGTINHTLLTLEAMRHRGLAVAGVIMSGPPNDANRQAIEHFSGIGVVAQLPLLSGADGLPGHPPLTWRPWEIQP